MIFSLYPSFIQALRHCEIYFNEPCLVNLRAAVSKLCSNGIFVMFSAKACRVNISDLEDIYGGPVPLSWFNKGVKAADYIGITFA